MLNAIFSALILGAHISLRTIACLVIVIVGFAVGVGGEIELSPKGLLAGLLSSVAVSLNSIYTKKVRNRNHPVRRPHTSQWRMLYV